MRLQLPISTSTTSHRGGAPLRASLVVAVMVAACTVAVAQTNSTASVKGTSSSVSVGTVSWATLTAAQKEALHPLLNAWPSLTDGQQRKWVAIAHNYSTMGIAEREKLQRRMVEWAALSPRDREQARLNFTQTKSIAPNDRTAEWEAYQALTPQERQKLADQATPKPTGAAVTVKPVPPSKLAPVPVTRHTPEEKRSEQVAKSPLDRNTLLPQASPENSAISKP